MLRSASVVEPRRVPQRPLLGTWSRSGAARFAWCRCRRVRPQRHLAEPPGSRIPHSVEWTPNAYLAFRGAIRAVRVHNDRNPGNAIASILCPGLGVGVGKMPFEVCAQQMRMAYDVCYRGQTFSPKTLLEAHDWHVGMTR